MADTSNDTKKRVTGIGGIFFKADDPEKLYQWYERHLGIKREPVVIFKWQQAPSENDQGQPGRPGMTVWSLFSKNTEYFNPSHAPFMINYRVDDLDALLALLREEGVVIDEKREDSEYGRFAWIMDPEGNRIELWQPPQGT